MKNCIKKTMSLCMALAMLTGASLCYNKAIKIEKSNVIVANAAPVLIEFGDFSYTKKSPTNVSISAYNGKGGDVTIPDSINVNGQKLTVSGIDSGVFSYNDNISSVTLPSTITTIGDSAFSGCSNLKKVNFNNGCNLSKINYMVFYNCKSLRSINIPSSVKTIDVSSFASCSSLENIYIPDSVTSINDAAFYNCSKLRTLNIPINCQYIGTNAFNGTAWLVNHNRQNLLVIENGFLIDGSYAARNVRIPNDVHTVCGGAFQDNKAIQKVIIDSNNLKAIGNSAFYNCQSLSEVSITSFSSITEIPDYCFQNCKSLTTISIPDSIASIGISAFDSCSRLSYIRMPNNLQTIKRGAFLNCTSLNNIDNINTSRNYLIECDTAFENCPNLKKINNTTVVAKNARGGMPMTYYMSFVKKYFSEVDNVGFINDYVDYKAEYVVKTIKDANPNYDQVQMAKALEDWVDVNSTSHNVDYDNSDRYHHASSVLLNSDGVCEGYAKGYNALLKAAGIESKVISNGLTHAWNYVKISDKWYHVDTFWDDKGSWSSHEYFLLTDEELKKKDTSAYHEFYR